MRRFLRTLFAATSSRRSSLEARLNLETCESRVVPASLGLKTAVLEFGGQALSGFQMSQGGWFGKPDTSVNGFRNLFHAKADKSVFDVNGSGTVNSLDADAAVNAIVKKVQQDYAPYHIQFIVDDFENQKGRIMDFMGGDAFMMITGGVNKIETSSSEGIFGVAPLDLGNHSDNIGFVFGRNIGDAAVSPADLINRTARTISHEMGHTFGLNHITDLTGDTVGHHLMNAPNEDGTIDPRDFGHDFMFLDQDFNTHSGKQSAHKILSDPWVVGVSEKAWIAVLKPGELTITGTNVADNIKVTADANNTKWTITGAGSSTTVTRQSLGLESHNPFTKELNIVRVAGLGSNDTIAANTSFLSQLFADGGDGNDTITGGSGHDNIRGGNGNDSIKGGEGDDELFGDGGDDKLFGGNHNDTLRGGDGQDTLFGEGHDDTLDGGDEFIPVKDFLFGGLGMDTFIQHQGWFWFIFDEDMFFDLAAGETVTNV